MSAPMVARLIVGDRTDPDGTTEAEPVRVEFGGGGNGVRFVLDDGIELLFFADELRAALRRPQGFASRADKRLAKH